MKTQLFLCLALVLSGGFIFPLAIPFACRGDDTNIVHNDKMSGVDDVQICNMKLKIILCLALVLSGILSGCSTIQPASPKTISYSKPSAETLQKINIERISLTQEQLAELALPPEDKREIGEPLLVEERPDWTRGGPWNTHLYIFDSAYTNPCVCVELLDHAAYEVHHPWLNSKMLFVEVPPRRASSV